MEMIATLLLSILAHLPIRPTWRADADGDMWVRLLDCDDGDPAINPDGIEAFYNGIDENCDGGDTCDLDGDGLIWHLSADVEFCRGYDPAARLDCDDTVDGGACW
jgi:hypothetical protein